VTGPAPTRPGSRRGRSASSPQAEDHRTPTRTKTCPPGTVRVTEPTASRKASAQLAHVSPRTTDSSTRAPERSECTESYRFPVHDPVHDWAGLPVTECHLLGRRMAFTEGHRLSRRCGQRGRG
jgi:hypothetical protein